jgi:hypothetical protein
LHKEAVEREKSKERLALSISKEKRKKIMANKPPTSNRKSHVKYSQAHFLREFEKAIVKTFEEFRDEVNY